MSIEVRVIRRWASVDFPRASRKVVGVKIDERENKSEASVDPPKAFSFRRIFWLFAQRFVQKPELRCIAALT